MDSAMTDPRGLGSDMLLSHIATHASGLPEPSRSWLMLYARELERRASILETNYNVHQALKGATSAR